MSYYYLFCTFLFGLIFGSFLNCTAMRIVRNEDFIHGSSHCMACGHDLGARDLIPVFSWMLSGGKCRYCKAKISVRYPLSEIAFALLVTGLFVKDGMSAAFACHAVLVGCLFALALVDLENFTIPDGCLIIGLIAYLVAAPFMLAGVREFLLHIAAGLTFGAAMLILSLIMDMILKKDSLGGGDIKLFALLGVYLGFVQTLFLLLLSCIIGLAFAAFYKAGHDDTGGAFPFGPAIAAAGYIMLLFGDKLGGWYMGLLL